MIAISDVVSYLAVVARTLFTVGPASAALFY